MNRSTALLASLVLSTSYAAGCGEDVGPCNDPNEARDLVLSGTSLQYAGQAIINKSCTVGCHNSMATGAGRRGAPAGLDFDIAPVSELLAKGKAKRGDTIVRLSADQLNGLWKRQRTIYQNRDLIWQQVRDGLMPPDGLTSGFGVLDGISTTSEACPREKEEKFVNLAEQQEVLRNWLACGAPIVESVGSVVEEPTTPGRVGYQYPECTSGGDGGASLEPGLVEGAVTLEKLREAQFFSCGGCHTPSSPPDLSTIDATFESLIDLDEEVCEGKPWIDKGNPDNSFLYDLLSKAQPGCGHMRMPQYLAPLTEDQLAQVADWIKNGAPLRNGDVVEPDETDGDEPSEDGEQPDGQDQEPDEGDNADADGSAEDQDDAGAGDEEELDAGASSRGRDAGVQDAGRDAGSRRR